MNGQSVTNAPRTIFVLFLIIIWTERLSYRPLCRESHTPPGAATTIERLWDDQHAPQEAKDSLHAGKARLLGR